MAIRTGTFIMDLPNGAYAGNQVAAIAHERVDEYLQPGERLQRIVDFSGVALNPPNDHTMRWHVEYTASSDG